MKLQLPINTHGRFWLADAPDNVSDGVLEISETEGVTLDLYGELAALFDSQPIQPRVWGLVHGGRAVTLVDCICVSSDITWNQTVISGIASARLRVIGYAFLGEHFGTDEISFADISGLVNCPRGLTLFKYPFERDTSPFYPTYRQPEPLTVKISDGLSISFCLMPHIMMVALPYPQYNMAARTHIQMNSTMPRPLSECMGMLEQVRSFIWLVSGCNVPITTINGMRHTGTLGNPAVEIYIGAGAHGSGKAGHVDHWHTAVTPAGIEQYLQYLPNWMKMHQSHNKVALDLYFTGIREGLREISVEASITILFTCLEIMNRVRHKLSNRENVSAKRVIECMTNGSLFKETFGDEGLGKFSATQAGDTRNYLAHYGNNPSAITDAAEMQDLYHLLELLVWMHLLEDIEMTPDGIKSMVDRHLQNAGSDGKLLGLCE